ncbi:hypothetical protein A7K94_0211015 [Modestobacter sp. VKM Ac-2676]|nr:hypothetical protein A7K94_0211015 [Modestobacter sp. VKM Ac-2676]
MAVAAVAWLGYRTPRAARRPAAGHRRARRSGAGPGAGRVGRGPRRPGERHRRPAPRSWRTATAPLVTGQAARAPGRLAADALVLLGSPGTGAGRASRLEAEEVYGAWTPVDLVSTSGYYGSSPADLGFGDVPLPTDPARGTPSTTTPTGPRWPPSGRSWPAPDRPR